MTLPRCSWSDLPRVMCDHCEAFAMTEAEAAYRRPYVDRIGEPSTLAGPSRDLRPGRPLGGYGGRSYSRAAEVSPAITGSPCQGAGCGRLAGDAFLCPVCADDVERYLADVPTLLEDLEVHAYGSVVFPGAGSGDSVRGISAASDLIHRIHHDLVAAFRILAEERGQLVDLGPDASSRTVAEWLLRHAAAIPLDPAGPDILNDLARWHAAALRAIDAPPERIYIGLCRADVNGHECGTPLHATVGTVRFNCPRCGTGHDVAAQLDEISRRVRDITATVDELVILARRDGHRVSRNTIRGLIRRGRLQQVGKSEPARYRAGDALALLADRDAS